MNNVTLSDLIAKIRKITARPSSNQISDSSIVDYINLFYEYDFPQNLKVFDFHTTYSFITQPNVAEYTLSQDDRNNFKSFEPPVFCSGYEISYYQNREQYFRLWPALFTQNTLTVATGIAGPYTGTLPGIPFLQNNVLVSVVGPTGVTLTASDVPTPGLTTGTFEGDVLGGLNGTIDYVTGNITLTWNAAIPNGNVITVKYVPYAASRPLSILYFDNKFTLRPVPDQAYKIELQTYTQPFAVTNPGDLPEEYTVTDLNAYPLLKDYFQLIAYGASRKIFLDSLEMDHLASIEPFYREQMNFAERKTMMQVKTQRTSTIYSDNPYWTANRLPTT